MDKVDKHKNYEKLFIIIFVKEVRHYTKEMFLWVMKFMNHILGLIVNWPTLGLLEQSKHVTGITLAMECVGELGL